METIATILLVEDNEDDVFLMNRALKKAGIKNPVQLARDGRAAIDYLAGVDKFSDRATYPIPAVVFLDLNLPLTRGEGVLKWIRSQSQFHSLPVVILSSSNEPSDFDITQKLGANAYMVKPPLGLQLLDLATTSKWNWIVRQEV